MSNQAKLSKIASLKAEAEALQREVYRSQSNCRHNWGQARYAPDHQEGYDIPADAPGTMGIDWRPACHVPSKTTPQWKRTCALCDLEQVTSRTMLAPGANGLKQEVPDFGS